MRERERYQGGAEFPFFKLHTKLVPVGLDINGFWLLEYW